ncbi:MULTISPECIES: LolA family protein [Streptomyces]|uniref:LolA family protein n=1 Tax=Streptomyces TaxID=1883 RepID=UPI0008319CDC|nr:MULTISPECIES: DUF2092 domain-containing protein [Streptomyces]MDN5380631.1 DUF2092 domain-containing protein [Streptomyces sp. LB8]
MAPYGSDDSIGAEEADGRPAGRRRAVRYAVPVAVVGMAAATIGLVPAIADSGSPDLPKITAQQLIEKIARSDVQQMSGTVRISTDLGLPDLGGLEKGLISGADKGGEGSSADPKSKLTELAFGTHTVRVATDGPDRQKISLIEDAAEYSLIHNGKDVWGYDSRSNEVFHGTVEDDGRTHDKHDKHRSEVPATPKDFADQLLKSVDDTTSVTVDGTAQVAGRDAYRLVVKPKHASGTTVGAVSIAVDAATGLPLKFTLTPASGGAAVVDAGFTRISYDKPAASAFDFTPPKGARITEEKDRGKDAGKEPGKDAHSRDLGPAGKGLARSGGPKIIGEGWNAVAVFDSGASGTEDGTPRAFGHGDPSRFLSSLGDRVSGAFGKGTVFSTRLINALMTDDGKVYVGAVTKEALVKAANSER